jgi:hypothetical protein
MKQPGVFFFLFGLSILIYFRFTGSLFQKDFLRYSMFLSAGFFLPLFTILIVIVCSGTLNKFWFWVIQYAFEYGSLVSISDGMVSLNQRMRVLWDFFPWLCLLTGVGFVLVVTGRFQKNTLAMLLLFGFYSVLALLPGWNFRSHYFILILPACSMLIGSGYLYIYYALKHRSGWKYVPALFYAFVVAQNIYAFRDYYFALAPVDVVRLNYTDNYFSESIPISNFLAAHTTPSDRIAIVGSEPQIFFYARRRSASSHIYMYGMMEPQPYARKMQEEFISHVESILPKYMLFFRIGSSWLVKTNSDMHIFHWLKEYTEQHYRPVGIVDLVDLYDVRYKWGSETLGYTPFSENAIFIFERRVSNR